MYTDAIVVVTLMVSFTDAMLTKFSMYGYFLNHASKGKIKLLYDLSSCKFCMHFWIAVFWSILYWVFIDYENTLLLLPFMVAGALNLLHGFRR